MVGTRRKSKAAAAAHSVDEASSPLSEVPHSFTLSIPEDVDLESLSEIVPDVNFNSLTGDNVISLYRLLLAQAVEGRSLTQELDEARAEIERKDVELDQALQDKESGSRESEAVLENVQQELNEVKRERDELAASRSALRVQLNSLQDSQSSTSSEIETLKQRVEDTEREKRDLVGVISRLKQENTQQEEEIQSLRASLKEARQEHQGLETQIRELRSTETATKFKIDSLSQQLELAQAEADRSSAELQNKTEEFSKYRRTKHAELTGIQASYDALTQTHASTQATLKTLQSAHTAQTHQLTQALAKVQDLTGQLAEQEATYASEANGLRRLVTMMEEREKQAKDIVENIEKEWAAIGEKSERREAALKAEIEREKQGRDIAEKRAEQFEGLLDRMGRGELSTPGRATPASPFRTPGTPGDVVDEGMLGLSPTVAIVSKAQKKGKTFTEVYSDYVRLQNELAQKTLEYDNMDRTLSAVLAQIEERAPILSQQRAEYERLQNEASQLASQLSQALSERDTQTGLAQENAQKLVNSSRENELLQKQLEDLGRQVQTLLRELARRDDPTIPSDEDLEGVAAVPAEDTETVITNNLVLFKSISGLQEQNQKLLKIVRELGRKMETEEREYKEAMEREQSDAVKEAHEAIQDMASELERQKAHYESLVQAYVKERDALRTMLDRTQKVTGEASAADGIEFPDVQRNDTMQELAEVQAQFDAYKMEMGMDSVRLRESHLAAQREAGQLSAALAKANAKIDYLTDRHRMNQEQLAMHNKEIDELSKRNQQLFDQWTRIDIECSRVTEDLQVANGRIEQLRNECANLRAEKKIWEGIQGRLVEENRSLTLERSHLSDLMANVQKMHNDLERSGENDRRRLENQLQLLEGQTQDLRLQITQERDSLRHITLQKEIEGKELQTRLDKSMQDLSKTREALVGAETSKKHLEERIEDLTKQLRGNEEKLAVYERRPSTSASISQPASQDMPREQQLEAEVAELRSQLKVTQVELTTAKSHVEQFQEIARANEEALVNITATYDEYRASTEAQIARHEAEYKALQEKLKSVQDEIAQFASRYSELQKTLETERAAWLSDKKGLEDTIVDITTSEKHSESDRALHENEIRTLEERAKAAEERYSSEVIAHAESIKAIDSLKRDLVSAQTAARDNLTAAETAKASLIASESSWNQQKEALDKEVSDLNTRCQDLASQNSILHQHLESVSSQATRIQQVAESASIQVGESESKGDADTKLQELRSVVAYLRKEKEIVDLQLELSKQENARLKAQIEHLSRTLDETRATLSEEREKAVENATSAAQHAELLERINQLNILRESNATLRSESENHAKRARELENKLHHLSQELDPAKEQARVAQAELEATKVQIGRLEEESRRWQERNSQLLSKYDRIDPAELQALKDELGQLQTEKTELEQVKAELEKNVASQRETIVAHETRVASLEKSFKDVKEALQKNNSVYRTRMAEFNAQKSTFNDEKRQFESKVASLEQANAALQSNLDKAIVSAPGATAASPENLSEQASAIAALTEERDKLLAEKSSWIAKTADGSAIPTEKAKQEWEGEKADLIRVRDEAVAKLKTAVEDAQKAAEEALNLKRQNEKFQAKLTSILKAKAAEQERQASGAETAAEAPKADQMVAAAKEELQKQHAEELKSLEQRLTVKYEAELHLAVEVAKKEAASSAPAPPPYEANHKAAIEAAIAEHEKTSQARHAEEIASAVERGRLEQVAKAKLKDAQLVKSQKKVKELEAQILEWKNAGLIPESSTTPLATAGGPAAAAAGTGPTAQHQPAEKAPSSATASSPVTPTTRTTAANTSLPQRPSLSLTTGPGTRGAGRGAGLSRGRILQRAVGGRGGAPRPAPGSGAQATGVSIMGAAGKRPREDAATTDDSLVKRLKPADATEATSSKPPVTLRRPPASGTS